MEKKILLVEDDVHFRKTLLNVLQKAGYVVVEAGNGEEGYQIAIKEPFSLIVTDVRLPQLDGVAMIEKLIKFKVNTKYVVIMTGYSDTDTFQRALDIGITMFLYKPFRMSEFLDAVRSKMGE